MLVLKSTRSSRYFVVAMATSGLALVHFVIFLSSSFSLESHANMLYVLFLVFAMGWVARRYLITRDFFDPLLLFLTVFAINFLCRPLYVSLTGHMPRGPWWNITNIVDYRRSMIELLPLLGFLVVGFWLGVKLSRMRQSQRKLNILSHYRIDPNRMILVIIFYTAIGIASFLFYVHLVGGFQYYVHNARAIKGEYSGLGYISLGGRALEAALLLIWARFMPKVNVVMVFYLGLISIGWFIGESRFKLVATLLLICVLWNYSVGRIKPSQLLLVLLVSVLLVVFATFYGVGGLFHNKGFLLLDSGLSLISTSNWGAADKAMFLINQVPHYSDYLYGLTFAELILAPIPRQWWPSKPVSAGRLFNIYFDPLAAGGKGLSVLGEAYWNFGYAGVFFAGLFLGLLVETSLKRVKGSRQISAYQVIPHAIILVFVMLLYLYASTFWDVMTNALELLAWIYLALWISRRDTRKKVGL